MRTTLNDVEIAKYFTEKGREFCLDLKNKDSIYFNKSKASYFSVAAALSLCWTKHAKYDEEFILYASDFIDGNTQVNNKIIELNSLRFGIDNLSNTLMNFRKFYRRIKELMPDFDTCSVNDINKLQSLLLTRLSNYRNNNEITAISTWLFLGPFKIILGNQERLWNVNGINAITLPTGLEVNKGIIKLKKLNYDFMEDFDLSWLDEVTSKNEDPLLNNYATSKMVHAHLVKIANITDVPVLYINNALHLYGRGDI